MFKILCLCDDDHRDKRFVLVQVSNILNMCGIFFFFYKILEIINTGCQYRVSWLYNHPSIRFLWINLNLADLSQTKRIFDFIF